MKMTIESTSKFVDLSTTRTGGVDVRARIWQGVSEGGVNVIVFIPRIAVADGQPLEAYSEFERELAEVSKPTVAVEAFPLRLIL